ncbi:MAG TPA: MaoC family dehydratase N-terminal domain-containing protein [Dehalococcoidia bacterium]
MTTEESLITDEMRAQIGKESPPTILEVDKTGIRMFARAVGYTDLIFYDEAYAKEQGYKTLPAPPGFLGTPQYRPRDASEGGPPVRSLNPRLRRVLNGGTEYEYLDTIYAGDVLTATTKIVDLQERQGSIGKMLITVRETTYKRGDQVVAKMRGTTINY